MTQALSPQAIRATLPNYMKQNSLALPSDDSNLQRFFSLDEYENIKALGGNKTDVSGEADEYGIQQFRFYVGARAVGLNVDCHLDSSFAPSSSPVVMEIYNLQTLTWDELDRDNVTAAGVFFDLTGVVADVIPYRSRRMTVTCRIWQNFSLPA